MSAYKLENRWFIEVDKKIIYKKSIPILSRLLTSIGRNKTDMRDLWNMIVRGLPIKASYPMIHDNFLKPEKYPNYFRLINGYTIDRESIKFLKNGPLFSENGTTVVVTEKIFIKTILGRLWEIVQAIAVILGILGTPLLSLYQFIKK